MMFDLEKEIRKWKKNLQKYEVFEDGFIADIELHLRDAYIIHKQDGLTDKDAFLHQRLNTPTHGRCP